VHIAGAPAPLAALTSHGASDAAAYISGEVLHVNGGQYFS